MYSEAVKLLRGRRQALVEELGKIDTAVRALGRIRMNAATTRRKPKFTKAGLASIAAAQRARWKKFKAARKK
jgi:hypothetical protein